MKYIHLGKTLDQTINITNNNLLHKAGGKILKRGKVILLNGVSSSGKSTLAKKLQECSEEKFYHIQQDTFCTMVHGKFYNKDYEKTEGDAVYVMYNFVLSLCKNGENSIIDTVILDQKENWLRQCVELLHEMPVTFVRVNCPLHELEKREVERGNRKLGLSKIQMENMKFNIYDLEVNTYEMSVEECVEEIIEKIAVESKSSAFRTLHKVYS